MWNRISATNVAATLLVLFLNANAFGQYGNQQGWPINGGGQSGYSNSYAPAANYATPSYSVPTTGYVAPATTAGTLTSTAPATPAMSTVAAEVPHDDSAILNIHMPADAKLFFDKEEAGGRTGAMRSFRSPPLEQGSNYQYVLRARWMENGQWVERTRTVPVRANDVVNVDFNRGG